MKLRDQPKESTRVGHLAKVLDLKAERLEDKEPVRMEVNNEEISLCINRRKSYHRDRSTISRVSIEVENHCAIIEKSDDEYFFNVTTNRQTNKPSADIFHHNQLHHTSNQLKSSDKTPLHSATIQARSMKRRSMLHQNINTYTSFSKQLFNSKLTSVLLATALISCLFTINQTQALSQASADSSMTNDDSTSAKASMLTSAARQDGKRDSNDRLDLLNESSSSASSSPQSSIVASLSSAVASAAAAAAVAAAQSSLSSSDARSLLSAAAGGAGGHHPQHGHQSRSPGLNLALKIADAIPEVPYNILHNMKKVDHAAPFYNVPNKLTATGSGKESGHNLLATALSASAGGLTGAADQLSSLFKSPLWKRISDGYGEFTSEFRSLFRAPPTPMKGPTSSTTKLIRDISVPALLMLLASAIPSDWRPVRTRRKSLLPSAQSATDPMMASASEQPNFSLPPAQLFKMAQSFPNMALQMPSSTSRSLNSLSQSSQTSFNNQLEQQQQQVVANPSGQPNMIAPVANDNSQWMSGQQQMGVRNQNFEAQAIKRIGDTYLPATSASSQTSGRSDIRAEQQQLSIKPVKQPGIFSSLTSSLDSAGRSRLMERIINTGGAGDNYLLNSYRIMSLTDGINRKSISARKDQLSDNHKYSLVGLDDSSSFADSSKAGALNESKSPTLAKPLPFLSAMTNILTSMLNSESSPLKSGSLSAIANSKEENNNNNNYYYGQETVGAKTINHRDSIARRQLLAQTPANNPEQRELSKLLPESWREAVKRTMNTVQHQASTQWRSIEGQVTNWVQDKLKTLPVAGASSHPSTANSIPAANAPVANIIATVSSTAMNMLGLGNNKVSSSSANSPASATTTIDKEASAAPGESSLAPGVSQKGKNDSPNKPSSAVQSAKGALVGVASMIVNTLTNRQQTPSLSSPSITKASSISEPQSVISSYPTISSAQLSATQSMASSTASTASALTSLMSA